MPVLIISRGFQGYLGNKYLKAWFVIESNHLPHLLAVVGSLDFFSAININFYAGKL